MNKYINFFVVALFLHGNTGFAASHNDNIPYQCSSSGGGGSDSVARLQACYGHQRSLPCHGATCAEAYNDFHKFEMYLIAEKKAKVDRLENTKDTTLSGEERAIQLQQAYAELTKLLTFSKADERGFQAKARQMGLKLRLSAQHNRNQYGAFDKDTASYFSSVTGMGAALSKKAAAANTANKDELGAASLGVTGHAQKVLDGVDSLYKLMNKEFAHNDPQYEAFMNEFGNNIKTARYALSEANLALKNLDSSSYGTDKYKSAVLTLNTRTTEMQKAWAAAEEFMNKEQAGDAAKAVKKEYDDVSDTLRPIVDSITSDTGKYGKLLITSGKVTDYNAWKDDNSKTVADIDSYETDFYSLSNDKQIAERQRASLNTENIHGMKANQARWNEYNNDIGVIGDKLNQGLIEMNNSGDTHRMSTFCPECAALQAKIFTHTNNFDNGKLVEIAGDAQQESDRWYQNMRLQHGVYTGEERVSSEAIKHLSEEKVRAIRNWHAIHNARRERHLKQLE